MRNPAKAAIAETYYSSTGRLHQNVFTGSAAIFATYRGLSDKLTNELHYATIVRGHGAKDLPVVMQYRRKVDAQPEVLKRMKLVVQIPCYNEAANIASTVAAIPRKVAGIDEIEILIIDDGSTDGTAELARKAGVDHIVRHRRNRGLAAAFQSGLDASLKAGADIIVNTDADNQYEAQDIPQLIEPILNGKADIVIGDRQVASNEHFSLKKRMLQVLGSGLVRRLAGVDISDAVSGYRAMSREAANQVNILSTFSYTTEMLIFAGKKRLAITSVPVRTNAPVRSSRLFRTVPQFIINTGLTLARVYTLYNPLRTLALIGGIIFLAGTIPVFRFLYLYAMGDGAGHIQSLVIGGTLVVLGFITFLFGIIADLIGRNRQMIEMSLVKLRQLEERIDGTEK